MSRHGAGWLALWMLAVGGCGGRHEFVTPMTTTPDDLVIRDVRVFDAPRAMLLAGTPRKDRQFDWTLAQRPDDHPSLSDLVV
jgi:hypothetical protein